MTNPTYKVHLRVGMDDYNNAALIGEVTYFFGDGRFANLGEVKVPFFGSGYEHDSPESIREEVLSLCARKAHVYFIGQSNMAVLESRLTGQESLLTFDVDTEYT